MTVQLVRSDSGATAYKSARYQYEGTETTETSITRVGGASDPTGQAQSRKIVTTANSQWLRPFKAEPYAIWNAVTGANVTVTVCGTVNAGALPNNDDIWMDVEYLGSSASPLGTIVNTTKANLLAANAAVASDGSTWNGGGSGAGWSPFKLVATLSSPQPGMAGYIHVRVRRRQAVDDLLHRSANRTELAPCTIFQIRQRSTKCLAATLGTGKSGRKRRD